MRHTMKLLPVTALLLLTACTVGENYHLPQLEIPAHWQSAKAQTENNEQKASEIAWWQQFHDPVLNQLIAKASEGNLDLQIAQSRIDAARAQVSATEASLLPTGNASATAERQGNRIAFPGPIDLSKPFNTFQTGFDASWELDLFGKSRRILESQSATLEASEATAADMRVSMLAEVASTYVQIRQYQQQLALAETTLATYEKTASITQKRYASGEIAGINATQTQAEADQAKSQLPYCHNLINTAQLSMDVLLGEQPGYAQKIIGATAPIPAPGEELILSAPAKVIADRPDIQTAERNLAAATAQKGVAVANFFPDVSISGFIGLLNVDAGNVLQAGSKSWSGRGNVLLPILNYGTLSAELDQASARKQEALATYRKTVLAALSDVERSVGTYTHQQEFRDALHKSRDQSSKAAKVASSRYKAGLSSYLEVLDAQRTLYNSQSKTLDADARYAQNLIAVYKSLGGGWQAKTEIPDATENEPADEPEEQK